MEVRFSVIGSLLVVLLSMLSCSSEDDFVEVIEDQESTEKFNLYHTWIKAEYVEKYNYVTYGVMTFYKDGTYEKEARQWNTSGAANEYYAKENGIIESVSDSEIVLKSNEGKSKKYYIRNNTLYNGGVDCYLPAKEKITLEEGFVPSTKYPAVYVRVDEYSSECKIYTANYYGTAKYDLVVNGTQYKDIELGKVMTIKKKEGENVLTISAKAYGQNGKAYPTKTVKYKYDYHDPDLDLPLNYYKYNGKVYPLDEAVFKVQHDLTSVNGTGTNWEYLYLNAPSTVYGINSIIITHGVHQWDPVSLYWPEGTYSITNNGNYYSYGCSLYNEGKGYDTGTGKITLKKKTSSYWVIDLSTEYVKAHFEGKGSYQ